MMCLIASQSEGADCYWCKWQLPAGHARRVGRLPNGSCSLSVFLSDCLSIPNFPFTSRMSIDIATSSSFFPFVNLNRDLFHLLYTARFTHTSPLDLQTQEIDIHHLMIR